MNTRTIDECDETPEPRCAGCGERIEGTVHWQQWFRPPDIPTRREPYCTKCWEADDE